MPSNAYLTEEDGIPFLSALIKHQVPFMIVGASAAVMQGAPISTIDVDLWFEELETDEISKALKDVGGIYVPPIGLNPPAFAGKGLTFFDIVLTPEGLKSFREEYKEALALPLGSIEVPVLPIERVILSKETAGREKDKAALPALKTAQKTIEEKNPRKRWMSI